jgi:hypothetical protein
MEELIAEMDKCIYASLWKFRSGCMTMYLINAKLEKCYDRASFGVF